MDHTPWQATYLRRREWVRSALRALAVLIAVFGMLGLTQLSSLAMSVPFGGAWANLLGGVAGPLTYFSVAATLAWFSTRLSRWIVPLPEPGCPRCGYSLDNLRSPICPECGLDLRPASSPPGGPDRAA